VTTPPAGNCLDEVPYDFFTYYRYPIVQEISPTGSHSLLGERTRESERERRVRERERDVRWERDRQRDRGEIESRKGEGRER